MANRTCHASVVTSKKCIYYTRPSYDHLHAIRISTARRPADQPKRSSEPRGGEGCLMRFPKSRLPLSPRDYAHFAKSGSRIRGFDPSRLPFLRGGIPPDMGESSNFLARDSCLREFAKRPPEARSGCDREQPASAPGAGRGGRSSVRRGTGRLAASGGGHVLSHAIKRRMSQVVSYGVDIFLITFMCSKDGNRRCNIYIYIYIYIYTHTYIYYFYPTR